MKWLASIATWSPIIGPQGLTRSRRKRRRPAVEHFAIDLGGRESQVCIRNERGEIVLEQRCATHRLGELLARRPPSRVIVETCAEAFGIADEAIRLGDEGRGGPAMLGQQLGGGGPGLQTALRGTPKLRQLAGPIQK